MAILSPKSTRNIVGTSRIAGFACNLQLSDDFVADGFKSPDTYSQYYAYPIDGPAVYAFVVIDTDTYLNGLVAYVGMSRNLEQRWISHPVLPMISRPGFHVKRWFKPVAKDDLRRIEREYIQRFDPPWNLQGRKRGVQFA